MKLKNLGDIANKLSNQMNQIHLLNKIGEDYKDRVKGPAGLRTHGMYVFYAPRPDVTEMYGFLAELDENMRPVRRNFNDGERMVVLQAPIDTTAAFTLLFYVMGTAENVGSPGAAYGSELLKTAAEHAYEYLQFGTVPPMALEKKSLN